MTKYQHYKGGIYKLLSTSVWHTETNERLAVYENAEGKIFARPYDMFFSKVMVDGEEVERFKEIRPKEIIPKVSIKQGKQKEKYRRNKNVQIPNQRQAED